MNEKELKFVKGLQAYYEEKLSEVSRKMAEAADWCLTAPIDMNMVPLFNTYSRIYLDLRDLVELT